MIIMVIGFRIQHLTLSWMTAFFNSSQGTSVLCLNYYNMCICDRHATRLWSIAIFGAMCYGFCLHTASTSNTLSLSGQTRVSRPTATCATDSPLKCLVVIMTVRHGSSSTPAARVSAKPDFQEQNGEGHAHAKAEYLKHGVYLPYGHADELAGPVRGIAHRPRRYPPSDDSVL